MMSSKLNPMRGREPLLLLVAVLLVGMCASASGAG